MLKINMPVSKQGTKPLSINKAARRTRYGKTSKRIIVSLGIDKRSTLYKVDRIAREVVKRIPDGDETEKVDRFRKSFQVKGETALTANKGVGSLHCVKRCGAALTLLRAAKIKSWLARQVHFDPFSGKYRIHDYVEFFYAGKIHTLAFGQNNTGVILSYPAEHVIVPGAFMGYKPSVFVFRGIDTAQIGGASSYKKFRRFLRNPMILKEIIKNKRRMELLIDSKIMPKEALDELKKEGYY